jgi:hypothetical protein
MFQGWNILPHKGKGGLMFPVETSLLSRLLYAELLHTAEQRRQSRLAGTESPFFLRLEFWTGEHLVRLGNRLMAKSSAMQYQSNLKSHAHMV